MVKLIIYHGTSKRNAEKIIKEGFKTNNIKNNWVVKSKEGFVSFSLSYAPFFAQATNKEELAIIKVEIDEEDLYPEDDFMMYLIGKPAYTKKELEEIDFEENKHLWRGSLKHMGNVNAKPDKIKIIGVTFFSSKNLLMKCDPVISPMNYMIMGRYYLEMTEWIYSGKPIEEFKNFI
jgi:hypothetical protein